MEEDEKRIEKKIDLLYKMYLEDEGIDDNLDEIILLFNLSTEMEKIKIKGFTKKEIISKIVEEAKELAKLQTDIMSGNILVKEKDKLNKMVYHQEEKLNKLVKIRNYYDNVKRSEETLRKELLRLELKRKLGIRLSKGDDYIRSDSYLKDIYEEKLKDKIDNLQELLEEYEKKFS